MAFNPLRVELELTERTVDPIVDRMDAVLRVGQQPDSSLISQTIASQRYVICASPDYLIGHIGSPPVWQREMERVSARPALSVL